MKKETPPVAFAKVDATAEAELGTRFEVQGYPTLKIFRKGKPFDYDGPREEEGEPFLFISLLIYVHWSFYEEVLEYHHPEPSPFRYCKYLLCEV